jgi:NitT/TauT family transport system substrate-binding protein
LQSKFGSRYRPIAKVSDVLPNVISNFLVASQDFIKNNPDQLRAIIRTYKQAVDFVNANPGEAAKIALSRMVNVDLPALDHAVERLTKARFYSDGRIDPQSLAGTHRLLEATGDIKEDFDFESIIDRRFLPE